MQLSKKDQATYAKLVKGLQGFRTRQQGSETDYLFHLQGVSVTHEDLIERAHGSFKLFLKSNKFYDAARYQKFLDGLKYVKEPTARTVGHEMVVALSKTEDTKKAPAAVKAAKDFVADHKVMPDARQSYRLMLAVGARLPGKASHEKETIAQLTVELEEVRAELRTERLKNRQLATEISDLKKPKKNGKKKTRSIAAHATV